MIQGGLHKLWVWYSTYLRRSENVKVAARDNDKIGWGKNACELRPIWWNAAIEIDSLFWVRVKSYYILVMRVPRYHLHVIAIYAIKTSCNAILYKKLVLRSWILKIVIPSRAESNYNCRPAFISLGRKQLRSVGKAKIITIMLIG